MKIAVLSDIHFGVRSNSRVFLDHFLEFFREEVVKRCNLLGVRHLVIAGDLFDHRKFTSTEILYELNHRFWPVVFREFSHVHILPGNHDVYHSNTLRVNVLETLIPSPVTIVGSSGAHVHLHMRPEIVQFAELEILMVPWICEENQEECLESIANNKHRATHVIGHFHLKGFSIGAGQLAENGLGAEIFLGYKEVASGHFHTLSEKTYKDTTVRYLSCPYEQTWADWNDPKGFHILDTRSGKYTFYQNFKRLFNKIRWSDVQKSLSSNTTSAVAQEYAGTYCRVIKDNSTTTCFESFMENLEKVALDVKVIEAGEAPKDAIALDPNTFIGDDDDVWMHIKAGISERKEVDQTKLENLFRELHKEALLRQA